MEAVESVYVHVLIPLLTVVGYNMPPGPKFLPLRWMVNFQVYFLTKSVKSENSVLRCAERIFIFLHSGFDVLLRQLVCGCIFLPCSAWFLWILLASQGGVIFSLRLRQKMKSCFGRLFFPILRGCKRFVALLQLRARFSLFLDSSTFTLSWFFPLFFCLKSLQ